MVDGGSLENCCAATHRGFESLFLRKKKVKSQTSSLGLAFYFLLASPPQAGGMSEGEARRNP